METLFYSVYCNCPTQGTDSILVFYKDELTCVYRVPWINSQEISECLDLRGAMIMSYNQAEYRLEKLKEQKLLKEARNLNLSSKRIAEKMLLDARKDEISLAYRSARNDYFKAIRDLELPDTCGDILNERMNKKEAAQAVFNVVRRVFETEISPVKEPGQYDGIGCLFDGVPGETIDSMYKQECGRE